MPRLSLRLVEQTVGILVARAPLVPPLDQLQDPVFAEEPDAVAPSAGGRFLAMRRESFQSQGELPEDDVRPGNDGLDIHVFVDPSLLPEAEELVGPLAIREGRSHLQVTPLVTWR